MGRWLNTETKVVVSVADDKDERFASPLWEAYDGTGSGPSAEASDQPAASQQVEPPAGNASQADWADWVIATRPDLDEESVRAMKRDDLREEYGPKPE